MLMLRETHLRSTMVQEGPSTRAIFSTEPDKGKDTDYGGVLHVHASAIANVSWLIQNATYRDHCYMCRTDGLQFKFSPTTPSTHSCAWKLVSDERRRHGNHQAFDKMLYDAIVLRPDYFKNGKFVKQNDIWKKFENYFHAVRGLLAYEPVFMDYIYEGLREFHADNVHYVELRSSLRKISGLHSAPGKEEYTLKKIIDVATRFMKAHPKMIGVKVIFSKYRVMSESHLEDLLNLSKHLIAIYPNWFAGYDFVGQEDTNPTLLHYLRELLPPLTSHPKLNYFFHAGETDWQGTPVDENLFDAILLNSSRLGHAYALIKHPALLKLVKQRQIAIEVNPISNQVLGLVHSLMNHPAAYLIAENYPVVISADDPVVWQAEGLSYDFYQIFFGVASQRADLRLLKQLAINSIKYSSLDDSRKQAALLKWSHSWNEFIQKIKVIINKPDVVG